MFLKGTVKSVLAIAFTETTAIHVHTYRSRCLVSVFGLVWTGPIASVHYH